jgi:ribonuclease HII
MRRAVEGLRLLPHRVVVDGNRVPALRMPVAAVVKGDAKVAAISAASILAKVHRDRLCRNWKAAFPAMVSLATRATPRPDTWQRFSARAPVPSTG